MMKLKEPEAVKVPAKVVQSTKNPEEVKDESEKELIGTEVAEVKTLGEKLFKDEKLFQKLTGSKDIQKKHKKDKKEFKPLGQSDDSD